MVRFRKSRKPKRRCSLLRRVVVRRHRLFAVLMPTLVMVATSGFVGALFIPRASFHEPGARVAASAALGMVPFVLALILLLRREHLADRNRPGTPRTCIVCVYDLSDLDPAGRCPECGSRYSDQHTHRILWLAALRWRPRTRRPRVSAAPPALPATDPR